MNGSPISGCVPSSQYRTAPIRKAPPKFAGVATVAFTKMACVELRVRSPMFQCPVRSSKWPKSPESSVLLCENVNTCLGSGFGVGEWRTRKSSRADVKFSLKPPGSVYWWYTLMRRHNWIVSPLTTCVPRGLPTRAWPEGWTTSTCTLISVTSGVGLMVGFEVGAATIVIAAP